MSKVMFRRLRFLLMIVLCLFFILGGRLAYLQIYQHEYYMFRAEENRFTKLPIPASRGKVFDQDGNELITNKPGFGVFLVDLDEGHDPQTLSFLADMLDMEKEEIKQAIHENRYTRYRPVHLKNVDHDTMAKISENRWQLHGVNIEVEPVRYYPYEEAGAHLMGFLSQAPPSDYFVDKWEEQGYSYREGDLVGQQGIEENWEAYLRGIDGEQLIETNSIGQAIDFLDREDPVPGNDLHLTLDIGLQEEILNILEEKIAELHDDDNNYADRASAVAINTKNGAIKAMASYPSYDPNTVKEDIRELSDDPRFPMVNFALNGAYPIGSAYKMVTAAAGLETGQVTESTRHNCTGTYSAVGTTMSCHSTHGRLDLRHAIAASCNIYFYKTGLDTGIDNLAHYTREMNLGKRTGFVDIPGETEGNVASREYKEEKYGERWYQAETMSAAIGQTYHRFTPLQLAAYTAIIANSGDHYRPFMVDKVESNEGEIIMESEPEIIRQADITQQTFDVIQEGMHQVTAENRGTASHHFNDFPVEVAGKTGSVQIARGDNGIPPHSLFVTYAPFEDPEIALAVIIEHGGYGAESAAPVARDILEEYFQE